MKSPFICILKMNAGMNYETTHIVYFSPTHTSQRVARAVAEGIGMGRRMETDLTTDRSEGIIRVEHELLVAAVPVYAGRVAPLALERLGRLRGSSSPAVVLAVYGNRDYEDALVELRDAVSRLGFTPLAAGAFVGEHSYSRPGMPIAEGRPDDADLEVARRFGKRALEKLVSVQGLQEVRPFPVKGHVPYREAGPSTPAAPVVDEALCAACGECVEVCPTGAVTVDAAGKVQTDKMKCIKCCACVKACPIGARTFDTPYTALLHAKCAARREPELFL